MRHLGLQLAWMMSACIGLVSIGCAPPSTNKPPIAADDLEHVDDHSGEADHKHPETYAEAVSMVSASRDQIRDAFAKGDTAAADTVVHEIGHTLEDVTGLAKKAALSEEDQVAVGLAVEKLLDAYGVIDEKLHGKQEVKYEESAAEIDSALQTLESFVNKAK